MKIHSYPKVLAFGHKWIQDIFDGEYYIEEKVDGSQISFALTDDLNIRSKGAELFVSAPDGMFKEGVEYIESIRGKLVRGWTYRGEYLKKPKHNTLVYGRIPNNHIMIFDIEDEFGNPMTPPVKRKYANLIGLECPPVFEVELKSADDILALLNTESFLGGTNIEGVVIKNYTKYTPDGKYMVGKYVSEKFKERNRRNWKETNPSGKDIVVRLAMELKNEARFKKAIQHLRDNGELTMSPKDIGGLLKEIHKDIEEEERDYIKDYLYNYHIKNIKRMVCGGFPEWYKEWLLKESF